MVNEFFDQHKDKILKVTETYFRVLLVKSKTKTKINFFGENYVNEFFDQHNHKIFLFPSIEIRLVERKNEEFVINWYGLLCVLFRGLPKKRGWRWHKNVIS